MEFKDKVVLITGAAGGIGKKTAQLFAREGAKLGLVDLSKEALESTISELGLEKGRALTLPADVSNEQQVMDYVKQTKQAFGRIDVFFNNAGIEGRFAMITDLKGEDVDKVYNVNVKGVFYGLKHVIPVMKEQKAGAIVNTSSVAGLMGSPGLGAYVMSKHAVLGWTKTAALESAEFSIRINAICPAPINTRMMRSIEAGASPQNAKAAQEAFAQTIPMKRYGEAEEVAQLVLFLASDRASYITGSYYTIDGGMSAT